jgi:glycosyltransferase involved in cell wall biosynthesis
MNVPARVPELSIIIPAYNEEGRLARTLARIREYFLGRRVPPGMAPSLSLEQLEILIVDDGSKDGTARIAEEWAREMPAVRLVSNGENRGKGYSVRHGMLEARGHIALFTDADLSSPIEEIEKLLAALAGGNDIAIGSRALDRSLISVHQSRHRELAGMVFNGFVRVITGCRFPIRSVGSRFSGGSLRGSFSSNSGSNDLDSIRKFYFWPSATDCALRKCRYAGRTMQLPRCKCYAIA